MGGQRPPPILGNSVWESTPMIAVESCVRICSCWLVGNTSMMRLTVPWRRWCAACRKPRGRFRRPRWPLDRFQVAHFTDEDHVGVHTQGAAQCLPGNRHVNADLALVDRPFLVRVVILDRVFERDDVVVDRFVDVVDHAGQRLWSCRTRWAGDEKQAAGTHDERTQTVGRPNCSKDRNLFGICRSTMPMFRAA